MKSKNLVLGGMLAAALVFGGFAVAQGPGVNVDSHRHPNLAEAQHHIQQAFGKLDEAQKANRDRLGGHAEKAKQLLDEANREIKEAAEFSDHHR
ncbi:MAG: hypothetical protein ACRD51_16860 [Candidatus Acidiferrum sp.]